MELAFSRNSQRCPVKVLGNPNAVGGAMSRNFFGTFLDNFCEFYRGDFFKVGSWPALVICNMHDIQEFRIQKDHKAVVAQKKCSLRSTGHRRLPKRYALTSFYNNYANISLLPPSSRLLQTCDVRHGQSALHIYDRHTTVSEWYRICYAYHGHTPNSVTALPINPLLVLILNVARL